MRADARARQARDCSCSGCLGQRLAQYLVLGGQELDLLDQFTSILLAININEGVEEPSHRRRMTPWQHPTKPNRRLRHTAVVVTSTLWLTPSASERCRDGCTDPSRCQPLSFGPPMTSYTILRLWRKATVELLRLSQYPTKAIASPPLLRLQSPHHRSAPDSAPPSILTAVFPLELTGYSSPVAAIVLIGMSRI